MNRSDGNFCLAATWSLAPLKGDCSIGHTGFLPLGAVSLLRSLSGLRLQQREQLAWGRGHYLEGTAWRQQHLFPWASLLLAQRLNCRLSQMDWVLPLAMVRVGYQSPERRGERSIGRFLKYETVSKQQEKVAMILLIHISCSMWLFNSMWFAH